ncbi:MAG: serine/threonine protein kinase [Mariniblastus sp.]|jgi:serine/threonine protein kinase
MNQPHCDTLALESLLNNDCDHAQELELELHLETCLICQASLSDLAAHEALWNQVSGHLSSADQIELPARLNSRLSETTAFVIPALDDNDPTSQVPNDVAAFSADTDWTRILDRPTHPEMLGRIDHFEIESKIGQGGMGIVLKGFDRELNRPVAIKVLSPHLAVVGTARKRFAREAESAAAVMHPNVVPIYSVNPSSTRPYIVMQLVSGHSLQSLVAEKGPLKPKEVVRISMQIAAGLAAAHKQGLIHRDVKPGNMLVERDVSRVMITDFGLARAADDAGMTQTGWLAGTPHYMSPEQSKGEALDERTDLFSLGSLMYFLATGREPFRGDQAYAVIQKIINQPQTHPSDANADVPQALAEIIEKLLEKELKHRFQSADEVCHVLEEYLAHLQQPTKTRAPKRILSARQKRNRAWTAGTCLTVAVGAACFATLAFLYPATPATPKLAATSGAEPISTEKSSELTEPVNATAPASVRPMTNSTHSGSPLTSGASTATPSPEPSTNPRTQFSFFSDDEFSQELSQTGDLLESLERSLNSTPLQSPASQPATWDPNSRLPAYDQLETQFDSFESDLRSHNNPFNENSTPRNPKDNR